jgi:5-methyltetrahydrofolate--homocysteine methyltransferase
VILGGAALNRRYVEEDLRAIYKGRLYYGEDAFAGLRIMDELAARKKLAGVGSAALKGVLSSSRSQRVVHDTGSIELNESRDVITQIEGVASRAKKKADGSPRHSTVTPAPDHPTPPFLGTKVRTDFDVKDVFGFLNDLTLFSTQWQFKKGGVKPAEYEKQMRETARPALARLKDLCLAENILRPAAVYGFFPASSVGDVLTVYHDDRRTPRATFAFPRQDHGEYLCLADYISPLTNGEAVDHVAFSAVTMGREVSKVAQDWYAAGKYQDYLYLHGLGVEAAEALAEMVHRRVRAEWGIGGEDSPDVRKLFKKHYRGCRYSFGYPACPALEDQATLFKLLDPGRIGLALSEQFQLEPEQSTTALILHHPAAKYFNVTQSGCQPS